jgi:hypothetical protein
MVRKMRTVRLPNPLMSVHYGWWFLGPYAHVTRGSLIVRSFVGPFSRRRAIRWAIKTVTEQAQYE